jgi:hypothetical protein
MPLTSGPARLRACLALAASLIASVADAGGPSKRECVAASESAQDLRIGGRLRDAREKFGLCVSASCPRPVREDCAQRLAEIDQSMPTVVFAAKDAAGEDLFAVSVRMDDQRVIERLDGTAVDIDPGEHKFTFETEGQPPVEKTVVVREGEKNRLVQVVLGSPPPPPPAAKRRLPPAPPASSNGSTQRAIGLGLGGGGVVAAAVGAVLAFTSKALYDHAVGTECGHRTDACTSQGIQDGHDAKLQAMAATASFVGAGVLLAAGATTYVTAPRGARIVPTVGVRGGGVVLQVPW